MKKFKRLKLNLQMYEDGGSTGATGVDAAPQSNGEDLSNVVYGKQSTGNAEPEEKPAEVGSSNTADQKRADFQALIRGEYADLYKEEVSNIVKRRVGETKELQEKLSKQDSVLQVLSQKYGETDMDKLLSAIEADDAYYEQEALDKGLTVEQLKAYKKMEAENRSLREAREEAERRRGADETVAKWRQQGEMTKAIYPDFDMETEIQNDDFTSLLRAGVDVKTAYQVIHQDEILGGAMQYTAQQVAKATTDNIRARGMRPSENGATSNAPANVKTDVTKLTKKDRAEIARRVARGDNIVF